ncbi:hypothetical protein TIFTF001_019616 [Ficus carica]|uniref:Uncharacterized protein n=1 Tax=Ficus carica TaxID=3494 RepID=A0AA88AC18_FICCA|nr:hypothetical protein TIFTF001_019616 [Ficus carica]
MPFSLLQSRMWKIGGQNLSVQVLNFATTASDRVRKDYECKNLVALPLTQGVAPTWLFFAVVMLFLVAIDALTYYGVNEFFAAACDRP